MSKRFNINGIPHFMVFKGGQVATEQSGLVPARTLVSLVQHASA
jgi:thioredoxin-like negative regulator of GroEL